MGACVDNNASIIFPDELDLVHNKTQALWREPTFAAVGESRTSLHSKSTTIAQTQKIQERYACILGEMAMSSNALHSAEQTANAHHCTHTTDASISSGKTTKLKFSLAFMFYQ
eukprot:GHVS01092775.1.p1 GENE.GHVS01092775.1~~GHVS01092775.1.p1  ORF type:complete len:113 (+),score=17.59 GHVS01092775.1:70-408(+)